MDPNYKREPFATHPGKSHQNNSCCPGVEVAKLQVLPHIEEVLLSKREYTFVQKLQVQQEFEGFKICWDLHVFLQKTGLSFHTNMIQYCKSWISAQASVANQRSSHWQLIGIASRSTRLLWSSRKRFPRNGS